MGNKYENPSRCDNSQDFCFVKNKEDTIYICRPLSFEKGLSGLRRRKSVIENIPVVEEDTCCCRRLRIPYTTVNANAMMRNEYPADFRETGSHFVSCS